MLGVTMKIIGKRQILFSSYDVSLVWSITPHHHKTDISLFKLWMKEVLFYFTKEIHA